MDTKPYFKIKKEKRFTKSCNIFVITLLAMIMGNCQKEQAKLLNLTHWIIMIYYNY